VYAVVVVVDVIVISNKYVRNSCYGAMIQRINVRIHRAV
jgi:hypothetical protein